MNIIDTAKRMKELFRLNAGTENMRAAMEAECPSWFSIVPTRAQLTAYWFLYGRQYFAPPKHVDCRCVVVAGVEITSASYDDPKGVILYGNNRNGDEIKEEVDVPANGSVVITNRAFYPMKESIR